MPLEVDELRAILERHVSNIRRGQRRLQQAIRAGRVARVIVGQYGAVPAGLEFVERRGEVEGLPESRIERHLAISFEHERHVAHLELQLAGKFNRLGGEVRSPLILIHDAVGVCVHRVELQHDISFGEFNAITEIELAVANCETNIAIDVIDGGFVGVRRGTAEQHQDRNRATKPRPAGVAEFVAQ